MSPFVITLAACGSSGSSTKPEGGSSTTTVAKPAPRDRHWLVIRDKATCQAFNTDACTFPDRAPNMPIPPCNPPEPTAYACPPNLAEGKSVVAVQRPTETDCVLETPPPQVRVPCPQ